MTPECFDVVIVGAGLSGIGAAYHLQHNCPGKNYVILEGRDALGGTWDLFRYPGIRSDSDMHTLGYEFKPWRAAKAIADGPSILEYVKECAAENAIEGRIRYGLHVKKAVWSSADATWTVEAERADTGETLRFGCNFLLMCAGYYSYEGGYLPDFAGRERFAGDVIHPQDWPQDLDFRDKQVIVIGSGATAMTLVPALAVSTRHVVMLQRSPTYVVSWPEQDLVANVLRRVLPERWAYRITRWKNTAFQQFLYFMTRIRPALVKRWLLGRVRKELGPEFDVETHFTPHYNPWDQRICLVPDSDFFNALKSGDASVVTDRIDTFTESGIRLESGAQLDADIIIAATGLNLVVLGGVQFSVDDEQVEFPRTYSYKGVMYSDVPNLVSTFGYINASWTLRADIIAKYACRLINHLDATGCRQCTPRLRDQERNMAARPWIDGFSSGYMQRAMPLFAKQGDHAPWINPQRYGRDKKMLLHEAVDDGVLMFDNRVRNSTGVSS